MDRLIKSRIAHENGDVEYTLDVGKITVNRHGDGFMRRVLDKLWEFEQGLVVAENSMINVNTILVNDLHDEDGGEVMRGGND